MNKSQKIAHLEMLESKGVVFKKDAAGVFVDVKSSRENKVDEALIKNARNVLRKMKEEVDAELTTSGSKTYVSAVKTSKGNEWRGADCENLSQGARSVNQYGDPDDAAEAANVYKAAKKVAASIEHQLNKDPTKLGPEDKEKRIIASKFGLNSKNSWDIRASDSKAINDGEFVMSADQKNEVGRMTMQGGTLTQVKGNLDTPNIKESTLSQADKKKIRDIANSTMRWCSNLGNFDAYPEDDTFVIEWGDMNPLYIQTATDDFRELEADGIGFDTMKSDSGSFYGRKFVFYKMEESKMNEGVMSERDIDLQDIAISILEQGYDCGHPFSSEDFTAKEIMDDYDLNEEDATTVLRYLDDEEMHGYAKEKSDGLNESKLNEDEAAVNDIYKYIHRNHYGDADFRRCRDAEDVANYIFDLDMGYDEDDVYIAARWLYDDIMEESTSRKPKGKSTKERLEEAKLGEGHMDAHKEYVRAYQVIREAIGTEDEFKSFDDIRSFIFSRPKQYPTLNKDVFKYSMRLWNAYKYEAGLED